MENIVLSVNGTIFGHHCIQYIQPHLVGKCPIKCFMTLEQLLAFLKLFDVEVVQIERKTDHVQLYVNGTYLHVYDPLTNVMPFDFECDAIMKCPDDIGFLLRKTPLVIHSFSTVFKNIENKRTRVINPNVCKSRILIFLKLGWVIYGNNIKVFMGPGPDLRGSGNKSECSICKENLNGVVTLRNARCCHGAKYIYHPKCFKERMEKCPLCNVPFALTPIDKALLEL